LASGEDTRLSPAFFFLRFSFTEEQGNWVFLSTVYYRRCFHLHLCHYYCLSILHIVRLPHSVLPTLLSSSFMPLLFSVYSPHR
jgi:hypothetical protein